ncbi:DUF6746 family protein [Neptuniibacter sp. SY11_33]|uniref:DUF6746 family protein n=1 Tax=Neptuniibacter sp. SY11_33 TaxID=3398215 RepID=UPI0039F45915
MKKLAGLFFALVFATSVQASGVSDGKPVQHLKIADISSFSDAKTVFIEKTLEMKGKQKLDAEELHEIHIITYSLEKSVAYFAEQSTGSDKELMEKIAVVVEEVHLNSENNRKDETKKELDTYFKLASEFIYNSWDNSIAQKAAK